MQLSKGITAAQTGIVIAVILIVAVGGTAAFFLSQPPPCNPFFPKPECNPLEEPSKAADSSLFTVKPPAGWKSDDGIAEASGADLAYWVPVVSNGRNHQAVILADAESTGLGTREYMNDAVTMLSTMGQNGLTPGIAKLSETDTHLGGQLARETTFMFLIDDGVGYGNYYVLARYVVTVRDRVAYSLIYMAPEYAFKDGLQDFHSSLQSFEILGRPAATWSPVQMLVMFAFVASVVGYSLIYWMRKPS